MNLLFVFISLPLAIWMLILAHVSFRDGEIGGGVVCALLAVLNFAAWVLNLLIVTGALQ